jgi:hypothetical protein
VCYYNPEKSNVDLYDALNYEYSNKDVRDEACFEIKGKAARLIVVLPAGSELTKENGNYMVGDKVVAYNSTSNEN